jgi:hypothetical protein
MCSAASRSFARSEALDQPHPPGVNLADAGSDAPSPLPEYESRRRGALQPSPLDAGPLFLRGRKCAYRC